MNDQPETKKVKQINTGKIGFILSFAAPVSIVASPIIILFLIPSSMPAWMLFLIPLVLFPLSIFYCIHGLVKKKSPKLAITGLLINPLSIVILCFLFITFTPPGSMPYPLNIYKFKRALECDFWLDYDREHIIDVQSQNTIILSKQGAIHFQATPNTYDKNSVIKYAEDNGWKYHLSVKLTKEDFDKYETGDDNNLSSYVIFLLKPSPILLKQDCTLFVFETGNIHGMPSYIMISKDLSEMVVFFYNARLPDPAMKFWIPEPFIELHEIQSQEKEDIK